MVQLVVLMREGAPSGSGLISAPSSAAPRVAGPARRRREVAVSTDEVMEESSPPVRSQRARHAFLDPRSEQRLGRSVGTAAAALVVLQIAAVVVFATITILRHPLWSVVDEGAHFDNIVYVAEHGSYPVLGKTLASEQELAIGQGVYPKHTTINPRTFGLGGLTYEAFQPPLYYYVAAPVFFLSGNYHTKAILLRFFGLVLLVTSIALFARLSRHVLRKRWLLGLSGGLLVFLMPGVVVRMVTISDVNLAVPLAILTVTELWITWQRQSSRRLVLCGFLVGCCALTDLYLTELVPVFVLVAIAVLRRNRRLEDRLAAILGVVVAGLVVLPWLVFNEVKYHALTATAIAKREQLGIVNPHHVRDTIGQLPGLTVQNLFQVLLPEDWGGRLIDHGTVNYLATIVQVLLVPAAIVLAVALGRRLVSTGYWILILPWACNIVACWYIDIGQQWQSGSMVSRYTYPTLPFVALFVVASTLTLFRATRQLLVAVTLSSAVLVGVWVVLVPTIHHTT
jgi:hypothetical protein